MLRQLIRGAVRSTALGLKHSPHHVTRHAMYAHLKAAMAPHVRPGRILAVSGSLSLGREVGLDVAGAIEGNYPEVRFTDLPYPGDTFDFVLSDQVLEHVEGDPQAAFDESLRVLKPGGIALHTTCFINPIHKYPGDYWRFSPDSLRYLARGFGEIVDCGGWGNRVAIAMMALGLRSQKIPLARWHPLHWIGTHNDPICPIVTWVAARK